RKVNASPSPTSGSLRVRCRRRTYDPHPPRQHQPPHRRPTHRGRTPSLQLPPRLRPPDAGPADLLRGPPRRGGEHGAYRGEAGVGAMSEDDRDEDMARLLWDLDGVRSDGSHIGATWADMLKRLPHTPHYSDLTLKVITRHREYAARVRAAWEELWG